MKFSKKIIAGIAASLMIMSAFSMSASAYGTDNNIPYSFKVKSNQELSYSGDVQYRGATTTATPWKVDFTFSAEGKGTKMDYFLAGNEWLTKTKQSEYKTVTQGSGAKYFHAYDTACKADVQLAARNNNYVSNDYTVAGYWDEETAQHNFSD